MPKPATSRGYGAAKIDSICSARPPEFSEGVAVIVLGVILLLLGFFLGINVLWTIGIILLVIGVVLFVLGRVGRPVGGRSHYF